MKLFKFFPQGAALPPWTQNAVQFDATVDTVGQGTIVLTAAYKTIKTKTVEYMVQHPGVYLAIGNDTEEHNMLNRKTCVIRKRNDHFAQVVSKVTTLTLSTHPIEPTKKALLLDTRLCGG